MHTVVGLEGREERQENSRKPSEKAEQASGAETATRVEAVNNETIDVEAVDVVNKANSIAYLSEQANIAAQSKGMLVREFLGIRWIEDEGQWQLRFKTDKDIGKKKAVHHPSRSMQKRVALNR